MFYIRKLHSNNSIDCTIERERTREQSNVGVFVVACLIIIIIVVVVVVIILDQARSRPASYSPESRSGGRK
jgi:t-SNARE complex subunit (syntaxin)